MTAYAVGDPDPTPDFGEHQQGCYQRHDIWVCTWPVGHEGPHVAGDGENICAVWEPSASAPSPQAQP